MNNEDRELLELAAIAWFGDKASWVRHCCRSNENDSRRWNPLREDGDALRLAVKLSLSIDVAGPTTTVFRHDIDGATGTDINDPYAATRRAIVRAAAAIGKQMKGE